MRRPYFFFFPMGLSSAILGLTAILSIGLPGCWKTVKPTPYDYTREPDPRGQPFKMGAGDRLRIDVWGDNTLSREVVVSPDGTFTLPLAGSITAADHTTDQLEDEIARRLAQFIKDTNLSVAVAIREVGSYHFTVSGNVTTPGRFVSATYVTVLEALAMAGEPNQFANLREVRILRTRGGRRSIPIDYQALRLGQRMEQNIVILAGDSVVVP